MREDGLPFLVGTLELVLQFPKITVLDWDHVSRKANETAAIRNNLTIDDIGILSLASDHLHVERALAILPDLDDDHLAAAASGLDGHDVAAVHMHRGARADACAERRARQTRESKRRQAKTCLFGKFGVAGGQLRRRAVVGRGGGDGGDP